MTGLPFKCLNNTSQSYLFKCLDGVGQAKIFGGFAGGFGVLAYACDTMGVHFYVPANLLD